jgi:hypothetical protein
MPATTPVAPATTPVPPPLPAAVSSQLPLELEFPAALAELHALLFSPVYYGLGVPRGDGHPVLLVPGFLGGDDYLLLLAGWLSRVGYRPALVGGGGPSVGSLPRLLERVVQRTETLAAGGRPVSLIGHSLGGHLARLTAAQRPDCVARVITLGSGVRRDRRGTHPLVEQLSRSLLSGHEDAAWVAQHALPIPSHVAVTSIYSRQDAVVHWEACVDPDPRVQHVEVPGSHVGLTWNAAVYHQLAGQLLR